MFTSKLHGLHVEVMVVTEAADIAQRVVGLFPLTTGTNLGQDSALWSAVFTPSNVGSGLMDGPDDEPTSL